MNGRDKQYTRKYRLEARISWEKNYGTVFRRFKDVNISMLEKLGWIFLTEQD